MSFHAEISPDEELDFLSLQSSTASVQHSSWKPTLLIRYGTSDTKTHENKPMQDDEGQTALHYASTCEFLDIVELLLKSGADPTLRDTEGYLPEEVTDCREITSLLQEHMASKT
ncbi:hypothetical protein lerEdw1_002574 [Lerista edwardsae]|nr:hypothetical protein lerEdw1_002574 [Lerista edwardsae]